MFETTSKEAAFKDWAQSISQKHCAEEVNQTEATSTVVNQQEQCRLDSYNISLGKKVYKQDAGC